MGSLGLLFRCTGHLFKGYVCLSIYPSVCPSYCAYFLIHPEIYKRLCRSVCPTIGPSGSNHGDILFPPCICRVSVSVCGGGLSILVNGQDGDWLKM